MTTAELRELKGKTTSRNVKRAITALYRAEVEAARYYRIIDENVTRLHMAQMWIAQFVGEQNNLTGGQAAELKRIIEGHPFPNAERAKKESAS